LPSLLFSTGRRPPSSSDIDAGADILNLARKDLPMSNLSPLFTPGAADRITLAPALPILRRVYSFLTGGIAFAVAGALVALYVGEPIPVRGAEGVAAVPPIVAFGMQHYFVMLLGYFGAFFVASAMRRRPGVNVVALFAYTFVTGLFLAPTLFIAQLLASEGATLDAAPVRDAFLLTGAAFVGLTGYTLATRKDFSFLGAALSMGIWVILGALLLSFFVHSAAFSLAIASVGVLLFCGYILYDTSRLLQDREEDDAIGAALRLFLDVVNLFVFLLRILSSSSRDR
jgi:modulator of FtsH protease